MVRQTVIALDAAVWESLSHEEPLPSVPFGMMRKLSEAASLMERADEEIALTKADLAEYKTNLEDRHAQIISELDALGTSALDCGRRACLTRQGHYAHTQIQCAEDLTVKISGGSEELSGLDESEPSALQNAIETIQEECDVQNELNDDDDFNDE